MGTALSWLNDLVQWVGRWIPRLVLVPPTHAAVTFGPRGGSKNRGAGLIFYWPITHLLVQVPITTQSVQPSGLMLPVMDRAGLVPTARLFRVAIQYHVVDAVAAAVRALSLHALVENRVKAAIIHAGGSITVSRPELEQELRRYGIALEAVDLVGDCVGIAFMTVADWTYSDREDGKRPGDA